MKASSLTGFLLSMIVVVSSAAVESARGDNLSTFPAKGDYASAGTWGDTLWTYDIQVGAAYRPIFANANLPNYDKTTGILSSPLLYFANTVNIGASAAFVGSAGPTGVAVGSANLMVKDSALTPPAGWSDTGVRKVYNSIINIDASGGGYELRIGSSAADQSASVGETESLSDSGDPSNDFPAQSFYDIFADLDVPQLGTFYNMAPFITSLTQPNYGSITTDPASGPYYIQALLATLTTPATIYARKDLAGAWMAGDDIGTAQLIPYGGLAPLPEPASTALIGVASCGLLLRRRKAATTPT
jgi:PEP-CTERM motif